MYRQQVNSLQSHIQELDANLKMEPEAAESASKLHANGTEAEIRASELEAKLQEGEALISELKTLAACLEAKVKELENEKAGGILDEDQNTGDAKEKVDATELQADGTEIAMLQSMLKTAEEKCEEFETQVKKLEHSLQEQGTNAQNLVERVTELEELLKRVQVWGLLGAHCCCTIFKALLFVVSFGSD
jgi:chromosome segregation ATPase